MKATCQILGMIASINCAPAAIRLDDVRCGMAVMIEERDDIPVCKGHRLTTVGSIFEPGL